MPDRRRDPRVPIEPDARALEVSASVRGHVADLGDTCVAVVHGAPGGPRADDATREKCSSDGSEDEADEHGRFLSGGRRAPARQRVPAWTASVAPARG